ncbi:GntR family transcriptional regulator [Neorhizobium galegae]|uniref:GntR family transcriptional regulator n=1 Tax=Neorhizobium galegae TaxID=399 RepID=UPI00062109B5|nr:GntR family transcriptional regulator [Neorhizobium galegae]MCQ1767452.1 GntR family transcriptional regulator [Neorhizobium galegae]MCQ1846397.1 GntR family transcriptional regulator [Neorhizobium galegae]CDZ28629.1 Transcriptional regulator [Neorhizobium galegae bv. officinalis]CDZ38314.1 Transcriptional regulator [Neorhizobium galegae bv. officinalis]
MNSLLDDSVADGEPDATQLILTDIQSGLFPPGAWLKQIDLEARYGRGRNEIRRALDRLAQKRVVEHVPNRGYHVYKADGKQADDIAEIRIILETGIVSKVVAMATAEDLGNLRALAERFENLTLHGTVLELYEANLSFHRAFVQLSGNDELDGTIAELRQRTSSAPVAQWKTRARIEQSALEHHEMVDLLEARNVNRLKSLIERHIRQR